MKYVYERCMQFSWPFALAFFKFFRDNCFHQIVFRYLFGCCGCFFFFFLNVSIIPEQLDCHFDTVKRAVANRIIESTACNTSEHSHRFRFLIIPVEKKSKR